MTAKENINEVDDDSDNDSVATEDIVEERVEVDEVKPDLTEAPAPEPAPVVSEPEPKPKRRGRPPGKKNGKICETIYHLTKGELCEMIYKQHTIMREQDEERERIKAELNMKLENKRVSKEKKPRTQKQIEATKRLVERNKLKRQQRIDSLKGDVKKQVKEEIDKDISELVQDEVVKIIQAPMRTLTPERQRKVKQVEEVQTSKYKSKF
jgi:hypothetical protein